MNSHIRRGLYRIYILWDVIIIILKGKSLYLLIRYPDFAICTDFFIILPLAAPWIIHFIICMFWCLISGYTKGSTNGCKGLIFPNIEEYASLAKENDTIGYLSAICILIFVCMLLAFCWSVKEVIMQLIQHKGSFQSEAIHLLVFIPYLAIPLIIFKIGAWIIEGFIKRD